jgi:hypothetical protein
MHHHCCLNDKNSMAYTFWYNGKTYQLQLNHHCVGYEKNSAKKLISTETYLETKCIVSSKK